MSFIFCCKTSGYWYWLCPLREPYGGAQRRPDGEASRKQRAERHGLLWSSSCLCNNSHPWSKLFLHARHFPHVFFFSSCSHKSCKRWVLLLLPFYSWNWALQWSVLLLVRGGSRGWAWGSVSTIRHSLTMCYTHSDVKGEAEGKISPFLSHTSSHARVSSVRGTASISIFRRFCLISP